MSVVTVSKELIEAIFQHLIKKPYDEVAHLVLPLQNQVAPQIAAAQQAEAAQAAADAAPPADAASAAAPAA